MQAEAERPLTVTACDQTLAKLAARLHDRTLADYELALLRADIDEWLERRFLCPLDPDLE